MPLSVSVLKQGQNTAHDSPFACKQYAYAAWLSCTLSQRVICMCVYVCQGWLTLFSSCLYACVCLCASTLFLSRRGKCRDLCCMHVYNSLMTHSHCVHVFVCVQCKHASFSLTHTHSRSTPTTDHRPNRAIS